MRRSIIDTPHFPSRPNQAERPFGPKYRFGFVLNTTIGNATRYRNLRKFAERDAEVECHWATVSHAPAPQSGSRWRRLLDRFVPFAALRLRLLSEVSPVLRKAHRLDAVMVHLFEAEVLLAVRRLFARRPALIASNDDAPVLDPSTYPLYPHQVSKSPWRQSLRLKLDRWRARRFDGFVPFSAWGADLLARACDIPRAKIAPIHVGIDLDVWTRRSARPEPAVGRFRMLFVGGDFERKGGARLIAAFARHFADVAELDVVSPQSPAQLPPFVAVHADLQPNDPRLVALYAAADVLVLPTLADLVPWAVLEAMAMECPVVATDVGAIPEMLAHGVAGFVVPPDDETALVAALRQLLDDPALRRRMGREGRLRIEREFDAAKNVPRILAFMKACANQRA